MEITDGERRYMHHYNAPGYTVGEVERVVQVVTKLVTDTGERTAPSLTEEIFHTLFARYW